MTYHIEAKAGTAAHDRASLVATLAIGAGTTGAVAGRQQEPNDTNANNANGDDNGELDDRD